MLAILYCNKFVGWCNCLCINCLISVKKKPKKPITVFLHLLEVPKLSSCAKAEDKLFKYLFGNYQKWVRPVDHLNQTIRVKFGLAISQLVDVVRKGIFQIAFFLTSVYTKTEACVGFKPEGKVLTHGLFFTWSRRWRLISVLSDII